MLCLNRKQNYEDLVSCSVCLDVFDGVNSSKLPKILPCQHTYCVECINHWMHCSSEKGKFDCPQCKFKIENLKDALELPTSRIVLTLLEKESLNYQGYASCPSCRQIRNLEVCFECNLPLCGHVIKTKQTIEFILKFILFIFKCISQHFDRWKIETNQQCKINEESLETYKERIGTFQFGINFNLKRKSNFFFLNFSRPNKSLYNKKFRISGDHSK